MTHLDQWQLTFHDPFVSRTRTAIHNEAMAISPNVRGAPFSSPSTVETLAQEILKGEAVAQINAFVGLVASTPGFADAASTPEDQPPDDSKITDAQITLAVKDNFPVVASLFYGGTPPAPVTPTLDTVTPASGGSGVDVTVTGTGLAGTTVMNIGNNCTNLVVSDTSVTGRIPGGGQKPVAGPYPVLLTIDGTVYTGPDFTVT